MPRCTVPSAVLLALMLFGPAVAAEPEVPTTPVGELPANQWCKLPAAAEPGYMWSQPIYVPTRGQILHWGLVLTEKAANRNDVRAFDSAGGDWASDYEPAAKLPPPISIHNEGKGLTYKGSGEMLEGVGTPAPSTIVNGVCWDSKRGQVVYTMKGLMAAYDPKTKTWRDMGAKTVDGDREFPGGPPVYGVATGYDPVNDEIVLFGHWGGLNTDLRDATGEVSAHTGTWRYTFTDNTWRRVGDTFGSDEVKAKRKALLAEMADLSDRLDVLYVQRHGRRGGEPDTAIADGARKLRDLRAKLDNELRVEPPARTGAPMVYDPATKCIVMFGGHDGLVRTDLRSGGRSPAVAGLDDTWLYDCTTRQWRELKTDRCPPPTRLPVMVRDPASGMMLMITLSSPYARGKDRAITTWALDVGKGEWSRLHRQQWPGQIGAWWTAALDEDDKLLVLTQVDHYAWPQSLKGQETLAMKLDASRLAAEPAPQRQADPPIEMHRPPADSPEWVAKLKELPANKWIHPRPARDADTRDWGNAADDPVTGFMYYFGGGHSTYQANDVAIFNPAAGAWSFSVGDHNDWLPPVNWGGIAMGYRGGGNAHHMRNAYVAVDNRMYIGNGTTSRRWGAEAGKREGPRYAWFYDLDRGGVWRQKKIDKVTLGEGVPGTWGGEHLATPDGRVIGFGGGLEPYDGRFFPGENYFAGYDIYANTLSVVKIPAPAPSPVLEYRPFCFVPGRGKAGQVFFQEFAGKKDKVELERTWIYDIAENRFTELEARRQPGGEPATLVYVAGQDAVFMVVNRSDQWVYSFRHKTWAPLPMQSDDPRLAFAGPYAQTVYSIPHGVLINTGNASRGVAIMRPDFSAVKWEE